MSTLSSLIGIVHDEYYDKGPNSEMSILNV